MMRVWCCVATDAYLPVGITDQDHLLKQFSIRSGFGYDLPEDQEKFLDGVVLKRKHKADDGHQQTGQLLTVQDHDDDFLQRLRLGFYLPLFCSRKEHKAIKDDSPALLHIRTSHGVLASVLTQISFKADF